MYQNQGFFCGRICARWWLFLAFPAPFSTTTESFMNWRLSAQRLTICCSFPTSQNQKYPTIGKAISFILILPSFVKGVIKSNGLTLHFQQLHGAQYFRNIFSIFSCSNTFIAEPTNKYWQAKYKSAIFTILFSLTVYNRLTITIINVNLVGKTHP